MDTKLVSNLPVPMPINFTLGSITTGTFEPPVGEVMKLEVTNLPQAQPKQLEPGTPPPLFGAHIREGIAVVKDWMKKP